MTPRHPVFVDLRNRLVVVVGGGAVAERKVEALIASGARVRLVSPQVTDRIREWSDGGQIDLVQRCYEVGDLRGAALAYVATGERAVNDAARREADAVGVWLNVADEPELCDVFAPAVVRRGDLVIAISTGGASPALAARLRERLEHQIGPAFETAVAQLGALRERCRQQGRPLDEVRKELDAIIDRVLEGGDSPKSEVGS